MLSALGIIIVIGLLVVGSGLGKIANILREIRSGQKEQLDVLHELGYAPTEQSIEESNDAGMLFRMLRELGDISSLLNVLVRLGDEPTLEGGHTIEEILANKHGILFNMHSQLRDIIGLLDRIADAVEPPSKEAAGEAGI